MTSPADFAAQLCADHELDPLCDRDACDAALVACAHHGSDVDPDTLPLPWQRSLARLLQRSRWSEGALAEHARTLMAIPALAAEFSNADNFVRWWEDAGVIASRLETSALSERLRSDARWRALRTLGLEVARAAEARDATAIVAAMRGAAAMLREMNCPLPRGKAA